MPHRGISGSNREPVCANALRCVWQAAAAAEAAAPSDNAEVTGHCKLNAQVYRRARLRPVWGIGPAKRPMQVDMEAEEKKTA